MCIYEDVLLSDVLFSYLGTRSQENEAAAEKKEG